MCSDDVRSHRATGSDIGDTHLDDDEMMSPLWVCMGVVNSSRPSWCKEGYDNDRHRGCYQVWLYTPEDAT